jgi:hypothetical protein
MGLFDWFARQIACPECGNGGALRTLFGRIRCPNRACTHFDASLASPEEKGPQAEPTATYRNPLTGEKITKPRRIAAFNPGARVIQVQYKNFRGEEKTFTGDARTLRRRHNHVSLRVSPSGTRIALARDRIRNLAELDAMLSKTPTRREQAIMAYHQKRGTTSPLFEQLRTKYPDW